MSNFELKASAPVHSVHLVDYSPWPLYASLSLLSLLTASSLIYPFICLLLVSMLWFRDIVRESKQGNHTKLVQRGITQGFILFLISEIMLFFSFFWAFFHSSLAPTIALALVWPPLGIHAVGYTTIPLLGSLVLVSSGFFVTLSHHAFLGGNKQLCLTHGILTIILGIAFLGLQFTEYTLGSFTISDSVFGSVFYMTTGLHAIHVIIGVLFLIVSYIRISRDSLTMEHHIGFEFSLFYYHLVDVVWLFVFVVYYWWGS